MLARASRLRKLVQLLALGLDSAEQVLPRVIEGLDALRLQVGSTIGYGSIASV